MDDFKNNASANVSIGYSASVTSIEVETGFGARFPTAPFNATWWNYEDFPDPDFDDDREIVRVTAISTDTLTITRAQEGTSATAKNISGKTYRIMATITAKTLDVDIEPKLLGTNRVTTAMVQSAAITLAKMANMATDSILGRATASAGVPEVLAALPWAFTGDVTSAADSNALSIASNAVVTAKIADGNVTLAKLANIATDSILGRATTGAGVPEVLTALPWAFTGDVTSVADANALTIATAAVSLAKMANMATDSIIGRATAGTGVPEILTSLPWANTGDVTRPADSVVNTIAADAVTYAKMQNVSAASRLIGRGSASGAGDPEEITLGSGLAMTGTTLSAALLISAKTGNYTVTALDSGTFFTNTGSSGTIIFTLPTAVAGYVYEFYAPVAQIITVTAPASTTIEYNGTVSASAGNASSSSAAAGVYMRVVCISTTKYVVTTATGAITIT